METITLIVMMGLPRSGKSTYAFEESKMFNAPVVNPDSIRLAMYGQAYIRSMEPYVWAVALTMVEALFLAGHKCVIVDATNINRKSRDKWQSDKWVTLFKHIDTPSEVCLQRAKDGKRDDLLPVIERMALEQEHLEKDEQAYA